METGTTAKMVDPALDKTPPSVWFVRPAHGRAPAERVRCYINFMRMTPEMFDELLDRISEMIEMLRSVDILYQLSRYRKMAARRAQRTVHGRRTGGGRS